MGVHANIGFDRFPQQGPLAGKRVEVCFCFNASEVVLGTCVRDDAEEPYRTVFALDDGRYVLTTECQYREVDIMDVRGAR